MILSFQYLLTIVFILLIQLKQTLIFQLNIFGKIDDLLVFCSQLSSHYFYFLLWFFNLLSLSVNFFVNFYNLPLLRVYNFMQSLYLITILVVFFPNVQKLMMCSFKLDSQLLCLEINSWAFRTIWIFLQSFYLCIFLVNISL